MWIDLPGAAGLTPVGAGTPTADPMKQWRSHLLLQSLKSLLSKTVDLVRLWTKGERSDAVKFVNHLTGVLLTHARPWAKFQSTARWNNFPAPTGNNSCKSIQNSQKWGVNQFEVHSIVFYIFLDVVHSSNLYSIKLVFTCMSLHEAKRGKRKETTTTLCPTLLNSGF